jgi:hypothetical protein
MRTPVGELHAMHRGGWQQEYWLKTAEDYRVMTYIINNAELSSNYHEFLQREQQLRPYGIALSFLGRTPIQSILVDYVGLENFAMHLFDLGNEVMMLYEALRKNFERKVDLVAGGPGHFVAVLENFTAETMGPERFKKFHLPIYEEYIPTLHNESKVVGTHFDGKLRSCSEQIAKSPVDLIESLTPPPEGDMTLVEARQAWPDKLFWSNISLANYQLEPAKLRKVVLDLVEQGSVDGARLAFEVSEELPQNWKDSIPVVLDALEETRA